MPAFRYRLRVHRARRQAEDGRSPRRRHPEFPCAGPPGSYVRHPALLCRFTGNVKVSVRPKLYSGRWPPLNLWPTCPHAWPGQPCPVVEAA